MMAVTSHVVGGVDPHADTIQVAVVTAVGKVVGDGEFRADAAGYARAPAMPARSSGPITRTSVTPAPRRWASRAS